MVELINDISQIVNNPRLKSRVSAKQFNELDTSIDLQEGGD